MSNLSKSLVCLMIAGSAAGVSKAARMENESVVFCSDLEPRTARLLFSPISVENVRRANQSQTFEEGVDYQIDSSGRMVLTENSRIPVLTYYGKEKDKRVYRFTDNEGRPFYSPGGTVKHKSYDVVVTYTYADGSLEQLMDGNWESKLTTVPEKLNKKTPLNVTFFGDSITYGAQASSLGRGCAPNAPAYPVRVLNALKAHYGYSDIQYANKAVGGKTSVWGLQEIQQVIDTAPDLVILAFGVNDSSGDTPSEVYQQNTEEMMKRLRTANPDVGIILVAPFFPNPEWDKAHYALRAENRDDLYELYSRYDNMAFVDVGAVSLQIAGKKKFQDFSGNDLNHPNDFMHRIYADLILRLFGIHPDGNTAEQLSQKTSV